MHKQRQGETSVAGGHQGLISESIDLPEWQQVSTN